MRTCGFSPLRARIQGGEHGRERLAELVDMFTRKRQGRADLQHIACLTSGADEHPALAQLVDDLGGSHRIGRAVVPAVMFGVV